VSFFRAELLLLPPALACPTAPRAPRASESKPMKRARAQSLYDQSLSVPQIRGDDLKIDSLKGKVVLVVNTASH